MFRSIFYNVSKKITRCYSVQRSYSIPDKYRNAFFLANAPLFDYTNWFIHYAYEVCFNDLVEKLLENDDRLSPGEAVEKVIKIINYLEPCNSLIDINFPVRRSDGNYEIVRGFRALHGLNLYDTPCLGGMRICSDLNKDHVRAFSVLSTFKHACMGIQMTGAHGGLKISGHGYDTAELKRIVTTYGRELCRRGLLGGQVDIIEPDLYCGSEEMAWIADDLSKNSDYNNLTGIACTVGKPCSSGGIRNYDRSLADGVILSLKLFLSNALIDEILEISESLSEKTFIIQGLGRIGSHIACMLTNAGAICVGVKEHDAFLYMPEGIPVKELIAHKNQMGSIQDFNSKIKPSMSDVIYTYDCDFLILAATHRSLQCFVAEKVKAKVVVEAAYAPITPTAHKILVAKKKLVLPDIFAGSGASITSYLEYVRNLQHAPFNILVSRLASATLHNNNLKELIFDDDEHMVKNTLEAIMKKSYEEILEIVDQYNLGLDVRTAAYINAINKIFRKVYETKNY